MGEIKAMAGEVSHLGKCSMLCSGGFLHLGGCLYCIFVEMIFKQEIIEMNALGWRKLPLLPAADVPGPPVSG